MYFIALLADDTCQANNTANRPADIMRNPALRFGNLVQAGSLNAQPPLVLLNGYYFMSDNLQHFPFLGRYLF
jgi:hypothetical protein